MRQRSWDRFTLIWLVFIAFISAVGACGGGGGGEGDDDDGDDDAIDDDDGGNGPTYENFAKGFFEEYCLFCHVDPLEGDVPFVLDSYDAVVEHLDEIREQAVELKSMPPDETPGEKPSDATREKLGEWIDAGAPE